MSQCSWLPSTPARELIFVESSICTIFLDRERMKDCPCRETWVLARDLMLLLLLSKGRNLACNTLVAVFMLEARQGMERYSRAIHVNIVAGNRISKRHLCKDQYLCPPHFPKLEELTRTHLLRYQRRLGQLCVANRAWCTAMPTEAYQEGWPEPCTCTFNTACTFPC